MASIAAVRARPSATAWIEARCDPGVDGGAEPASADVSGDQFVAPDAMTGLRISAIDRHGRSVEVGDRMGIVVVRHDHHRVVVAGLSGGKIVVKRADDGDLGLESQHEREATGLPDEEIRIEPAVVEGARTVEYRRWIEAVVTQCCGEPRPEPIDVGATSGQSYMGRVAMLTDVSTWR